MRELAHLRLVSVILALTSCPCRLNAQGASCPNGPLLLSPADGVYSEAMKLKQTLETHGCTVRCIFPTKLGSIFQVDEGGALRSTVAGEANLRTNYGDVEAVFLANGQTFANFRITERRDGDGYMYTFGGTPRVWEANRFGTARRMYFLQQGNFLLFLNEPVLMHRLEQVLQTRHRKLSVKDK